LDKSLQALFENEKLLEEQKPLHTQGFCFLELHQVLRVKSQEREGKYYQEICRECYPSPKSTFHGKRLVKILTSKGISHVIPQSSLLPRNYERKTNKYLLQSSTGAQTN
jgi:hypothetical protein